MEGAAGHASVFDYNVYMYTRDEAFVLSNIKNNYIDENLKKPCKHKGHLLCYNLLCT